MPKSEAGTEMKHVDLMFGSAILRNKFLDLQKNESGGRAVYGAGSSFFMDFNLLSHLNCLQGFRL